jgi:hypothetical protein
MLTQLQKARPAHQAIVTRPPVLPFETDQYLILASEGGSEGGSMWTKDPQAATQFPSMREAARAAIRLPSALRAYGLPRVRDLPVRAAH